jgi:enoyl-CoA hydratase/carnithine racemase
MVEGAVTRLDNLLVRRDGPAAIVTLNRPEKRNALSLELLRELLTVLAELGSEPAVRAVVIEGAGPAFSGGHDLAEMVDRDPEFYRELFDVCTELMTTIHRLPQPVIARVHGIATAAGCQLVATCDLAIASDDARFGTSGVRTGLFCTTPGVAVARAIGRKQALELLLTGELVDARTALDWGLVNRVVPRAELDAEVHAFVERIAALSPVAIAMGKAAFYAQTELDEQDAYGLAKGVMAANALEPDAQEGMSAFLGKRTLGPADWPSTRG